MRFETSNALGKKSFLIIPESEHESKIIDEYLGSGIPTQIEGKVDLADGYGQHYIAIWKKEGVEDGK